MKVKTTNKIAMASVLLLTLAMSTTVFANDFETFKNNNYYSMMDSVNLEDMYNHMKDNGMSDSEIESMFGYMNNRFENTERNCSSNNRNTTSNRSTTNYQNGRYNCHNNY